MEPLEKFVVQRNGKTVCIVQAEVAIIEGVDQLTVSVRRRETDDPEATATWFVVDDGNGGHTLLMSSQHVATGVCLAGCLAQIAADTSPVVACLKKAKTRADARKCIPKSIAFSIVGILSCVYGCLSI